MHSLSIRSRNLNTLKAELKTLVPTSLPQVFYLFFCGLAGLFLYRPMRELDFFWRIVLGESLILNSKVYSYNLPTWGSYDANWRTSQPLGEVILTVIYKLGGLELISVCRIGVWIFVVWKIYQLLILGGNFRKCSKATQFLLTVYALISVYLLLPFIQERPQTIFLLLLVTVAPNLMDTFLNSSSGIKTHTWLVLSLSLFIHPAWVIIYVFILFHFVRGVIPRHSYKYRDYLLLIGIPVLPMMGPSGVNYYLNLIDISKMGRSFISEWQPLWSMDFSQPVLFLFFFQFVLTFLLSVELAEKLAPEHKILFLGLIGLLQIFAVFAVRNLPIATILSIALLSVSTYYQEENVDITKQDSLTQLPDISSIEGIPTFFRLIPIGFLIIALTVSINQSFKSSEDFERIAPIEILQSMKDLGTAKVLNSSNEGGYIHFFAGNSVYPYLDGRIDRYTRGKLYYLDKLFSSKNGAKELKSAEFMKATDILIPHENNLRPSAESGFRFICQENGFLWFSRQAEANC